MKENAAVAGPLPQPRQNLGRAADEERINQPDGRSLPDHQQNNAEDDLIGCHHRCADGRESFVLIGIRNAGLNLDVLKCGLLAQTLYSSYSSRRRSQIEM